MFTPTLHELQQALVISEKISALEAELTAIFSGARSSEHGTAKASIGSKVDGRKGKKSPETIAKMKAAQRARWADKKAPAPIAKAHASAKQKGGMSAEGRARIVAAQKARWAKIKGEKSGDAKTKSQAPTAKRAPAAEDSNPRAATKNKPWYAA